MAYLSILDGVRAVAVLLVVACHLVSKLCGTLEPPGYSLATVGSLGVAIFFVHTALVLLGSLKRHGSAPLPFYIRRIFRIYPLSTTVLLLIALAHLLARVPLEGATLVSNMLLIQNLFEERLYLGQLWSLPYEVQMYLCLPILYAIVTHTKRPILWIAILSVAAITVAAADPANLSRFRVTGITASFMRYVPCFMGGVLAFALSARVPQVLRPVWLAAFLACCIVFAPMLVSSGFPENPLLWTVCLLLGCAIPACQKMTSKPIAAATKTIATYSYGIYLTHMFAFFALDGLVPGPVVVQWAAMLILLAGLPYVFYHGVEKRGIALGERIAARFDKSQEQSFAVVTGNDKAGGF